MDTLIQDVKFSVRTLAKRPLFTVVAALTLALGIGGNTAIFTVVNAVLLKPLPYPEAGALVFLWESDRRTDETSSPAGPLNLADWQSQTQTFEHLAGYAYGDFTDTGGDRPERLSGIVVSASFFSVVGRKPVLGRDFLPEEDAPGKTRVVILSHAYWQRRFAGAADAVGKTMALNGESYTVVGVMPARFDFPEWTDFWTPLGLDLAEINRGSRFLQAIGRLETGVGFEAAQAEMTTIAGRLEEQYPDTNTGSGVRLVPFRDELVGEARSGLLVLWTAVGLVLLIACANVANLLLARGSERSSEIAVRIALGAGRKRLVRQLLVESLILSTLGASAGLALAGWSLGPLLSGSPVPLPASTEVGLDGWALAFTLVLAVVSGVLFQLLPALKTTDVDLGESLKEGGRGSAGARGQRRLRSIMVVAEVALALVLLAGAGLLIRSFVHLRGVDPGFDPDDLLTFRTNLPAAKYAENDRRTTFVREALERIEAIPGVDSAGLVSNLPFSGSSSMSSFDVVGRERAPGEAVQANFRQVSPGYLETMGIELLRGRTITAADRRDAPGVVIVNQALARKYWPGEEVLGKRLAIGSPEEVAIYGEPVERTVVAVVEDLRHHRLREAPAPEMYVPIEQLPSRRLAAAIKTSVAPETLADAVRDAVVAVDPDQPVYSLTTMGRRLERSLRASRFNSYLLGIFSALALTLAALGLYGVIALSVQQRVREIGVRMALGARRRDIEVMVVREGLKLTLSGAAIGLLAAFALTRFLSGQLYGVGATDPLTLGGVSALVLAVALAASLWPARRASAVNAVEALRSE